MAERLASAFAGTLRSARQARGWTQAELAERIGVAVEAYGRLERGRVLPRAETLVKLAMALGVPADALLGLGGPARATQPLFVAEPGLEEIRPEVHRLMRRLRAASPRTVGLLNAFLGSLERDLRRRRGSSGT